MEKIILQINLILFINNLKNTIKKGFFLIIKNNYFEVLLGLFTSSCLGFRNSRIFELVFSGSIM